MLTCKFFEYDWRGRRVGEPCVAHYDADTLVAYVEQAFRRGGECMVDVLRPGETINLHPGIAQTWRTLYCRRSRFHDIGWEAFAAELRAELAPLNSGE